MAHQQSSPESQLLGLDRCAIDSLPEEVLARVLSLLQPCQLHWVERVNKRLRNSVVQHDLWRIHCNRSCTNFQAAVEGSDSESLRQVLTELRRLSDAQSPCTCSAKESLIAEAVQASSTDNDEERIQNVLQPSARMRGFFNACYWSSGPSEDVDSSEALDFKLAHPVCVVHEVHLQPFKAYFQPGQPLYPSKAVRFHFASSLQQLECAAGENSSSSCCHFCTAEYPVENSDSLQRFSIPPTLCIGGFVRVELIGRVQRQQEDNRYYTCIRYVKVVGTPVYGFLPSTSQPSRSSDLQSCESACVSLDHEHHDSVDQQLSRLPYLVPRLYTSSAEEESSNSAATLAAGSTLASGRALKAVLQDPLLAAGGLRRVSEMGRLLLEQHLMDDAASDHDSLNGDSDDGDFVAEAVLDDSDDEDPMDLAHGVGLQMGAHLAHVPLHELLGGHLGGIGDDDDGEYPLIYD
ncbi:hypothetical protein WJX82_009068 [Trebouxia sp. C0006]